MRRDLYVTGTPSLIADRITVHHVNKSEVQISCDLLLAIVPPAKTNPRFYLIVKNKFTIIISNSNNSISISHTITITIIYY
jgi:hypothetical protein